MDVSYFVTTHRLSHNFVKNDKTKHIEIDRHFNQRKVRWWIDSNKVYSYWVLTGCCIDKGLANRMSQFTNLQAGNDKYLFTS